ncbi:NAD-dependent epimerase/dehydratase family protein [uncultured Phycicoccus sp.]|uniref:NAD-dependent epimerase/dehydratase family protein n=1 Tax=uncultured Phycicoccus sp. TaxID=661422 RepID=UPI0026084FFE|nr:NAD-dependent epimerase/dehydratase family protein [uncultured Phycicoccus sp.]
MASVVLVTGVSRYLGGLLARRLAAEPGVDHVVGVDVIPPPHDIGDVEFVRADIRNPMISRVIEQAGVDTVVHMNVIATPTFVGGRTPQKEINVIGTMQLLAACQKSRTVRRLVVKSSAAVYGSTARDPALFTEDMSARRTPSGGFGKDSIEVEGYVRGFARRRPDTEILMLRFANVIGPRIRTSITDYFSLPVVPVPLGYDARMQFVHEDDAIDALVLGGSGSATGVVNVAGDGVVTVYQAVALAGRAVLPIPLQSAGFVGGVARRVGLADFSPDQMSFLAFGRGLDTTRMRTELGFEPRFTSLEAFGDFARTLRPAVPGGQVVGDAVSGLAGTASAAVLRALGTGQGR